LGALEKLAEEWIAWFNRGAFESPERFYADDTELQRMGIQESLRGRANVAGFLQAERRAYPGLRLEPIETVSEGDAIAIEATVEGIPEGDERPDTPYLRGGPLLTFLTVQDGLITQDHSYVSGVSQRIPPVGLDNVRYVPSPSELHPLLRLWEDTYNTDPTAMMMECYTADGTVQAMRPGAEPVPREPQIAMERKSAEVFPGRSIHMKRWLSSPDVIAVEFDWQGIHRRDPSRNLYTISACFLRLRDGRIAIDHTYVPTGPA
jgi:hypothetical protein